MLLMRLLRSALFLRLVKWLAPKVFVYIKAYIKKRRATRR